MDEGLPAGRERRGPGRYAVRVTMPLDILPLSEDVTASRLQLCQLPALDHASATLPWILPMQLSHELRAKMSTPTASFSTAIEAPAQRPAPLVQMAPYPSISLGSGNLTHKTIGR